MHQPQMETDLWSGASVPATGQTQQEEPENSNQEQIDPLELLAEWNENLLELVNVGLEHGLTKAQLGSKMLPVATGNPFCLEFSD